MSQECLRSRRHSFSVSIIPSAKGFGSKLNSEVGGGVRSAGSSLGRTFGKLFVLGAGVIAAAGVGNFLKGSIAEAREAQKTGALTTAVLKSTGGAANVTAGQVGKLATALSNKIGVDDEAIQAGENMLLTFTNVRNEVGKGNDIFTQATRTVQDMAAAFGGDATSNSKILGKALNDPVKGVSALTRVGVQFTDQQKEQIKSLVDSGQTMKAQKIILGELTKQTQGAAESQATSGMKAKVAWDNLKETVGTALLPVLDKLENVFSKRIAPAIQNVLSGSSSLSPAFAKVGSVFRGVGTIVSRIVQAFGVLFGSGGIDQKLDGFADSLDYAFGNTGKLAEPLGVAFGYIAAAVQSAIPVVLGLLSNMQTAAANLAPVVAALVAEFLSLLPPVVSLAASIASNLGPALVAVTGFLGQHATTVKAVVVAIVAMVTAYKIAQLATAAFAVVQGVLNAVLAANPIGIVVLALVGLAAGLIYAYKHSETFRNIVNGAFAAIKAVVVPTISFIVDFVKSHWGLLVSLIGGPIGIVAVQVIKHFGTIKSIVGAVASFVVDSAKKYAQFAKAVIDHVGDVVAFFKELPGKIKGFLAGLPGDLARIGAQIIEGLVRGIQGAAGKVAGAVKAIVDKIPSKIRSLMGISSPSKVTAELGRFIGDGLADGIASKTGKVSDATQKLVDATKAKLDDLKQQFSSIKDSVSSAFTGDLFSPTDAASFLSGLTTTHGTLAALSTAFKKLVKEGVAPSFLSALFQSGNSALILDLAAGSRSQALASASEFGAITNLSDKLGGQVAKADLGPRIDKTNQLLADLPHKVGQEVSRALNRTSARALRAA